MEQKAAWLRSTGRFVRKQSEFRSQIGTPDFPADASRLHLYVSYACPWAHRTLLMRNFLNLPISVDVVDWRMQEDGSWVFSGDVPGATVDSLAGHASLQDVYRAADSAFQAIGTVPVLWDKVAGTLVNNESREIVRMFSTQIDNRLLPNDLVAEIDAMIDANYETVNNGVYKAGFAGTQDAYDEAVATLFGRLDELERHLEGRDWLVGPGKGVLTEADVCLWPTLVRFDAVYHGHFKCDRNLLREMPNLWAYVRRFAALPGVRDTVRWNHIRAHYYWSHTSLNPRRIVSIGPDVDALVFGHA